MSEDRAKPKHRKLTLKQQRFVDSYLESGNATQAAIVAGYSKKTAYQSGAENLKKPQIRFAIHQRVNAIESAKIAKADEVMRYLTDVLRGDARETLVVGTGDGAVTVENPPNIKDRISAGRELLKRYPGGDNLLDAKTRREEAMADIAEMQRDELSGEGYKNPLLDAIAKGAKALLPKEAQDENQSDGG